MKKLIKNYNRSINNLFTKFSCKERYFIREVTDYNWTIKEENSMYFLSYWIDDNDIETAVVSKKDDKPVLYEIEDFTMVVAIECIKIAFLFKNSNNIV